MEEETGKTSEEAVSHTGKNGKKMSNLQLRLLTGTVYCIILVLSFLLKIFVHDLLFDCVVLIMSIMGTVEMFRATKEEMLSCQRVIVMTFSILVIITYAVTDFVFTDLLDIGLIPGVRPPSQVGRNYAMHITTGVFMAGVAVLFALLVFRHEQTSLRSIGYSLLCYCYPTLFLVVLSVCNHLTIYSELAVLFVFVICPFADSFAFLFGKLFGKRLPMKLAPNISPKKTLIGGLGGLIGGALGAVAIFFVCYGLVLLSDNGIIAPLGWRLTISPLNLLFFIGLGVLTSAFSQFGDLVESGLKRKLGIKDMGNILPGHGGILDRIDSTLYASLVVSLAMIVRIMLVG